MTSFCGKFEYIPNQCIGTDNPVLMTHPDHIIFCFFENRGYLEAITTSPETPFIFSVRKQGVLFTNMHALGHPSYPEYIRFFAATPNGISSDNCLSTTNWTIPNLYTQLASVGKTFAWYSEDLPAMGSKVCSSGYYREKHNPVTLFSNVPDSANKRFADFPTDYNQLENVVCISPNMMHNMHDGTIRQADDWLRELSPLIDWCKTNNSIFVIYYDENDGAAGNAVPVIAVGEHVSVNCEVASHYDHYNWTRTLCTMFGAANNWSPNLTSRNDIYGCWN